MLFYNKKAFNDIEIFSWFTSVMFVFICMCITQPNVPSMNFILKICHIIFTQITYEFRVKIFYVILSCRMKKMWKNSTPHPKNVRIYTKMTRISCEFSRMNYKQCLICFNCMRGTFGCVVFLWIVGLCLVWVVLKFDIFYHSCYPVCIFCR